MSFLSAGDIIGLRATLDLFANCHLTKISQASGVDAYGDPSGTTDLWTGSAPGYLERAHTEVKVRPSGAGREQAPEIVGTEWRTTLTVLLDAADLLAAAGTTWNELTVTVSDERVTPAVTRVYLVQEATDVAYGTLDSVTLVLADQAAA